MVTRCAAALCIALVAGFASSGARGDHVEILMERGQKGSKRVLVLRQVLDFVHGFDSYYLEEFAGPENKRVSRVGLAAGRRNTLSRHGQFELYMKKVEEDKALHLARFEKKGYKPVCNLALIDPVGSEELEFVSAGRELTLKLKRGRKDSIVLDGGKSGSYTLMKFKDGGSRNDQDEVRIAGRVLAQVSLTNRSRMLVVVVRKFLFPSPQNAQEEEFFFFPLRRASKRLGLKYPFQCDSCKQDDGTNQ